MGGGDGGGHHHRRGHERRRSEGRIRSRNRSWKRSMSKKRKRLSDQESRGRAPPPPPLPRGGCSWQLWWRQRRHSHRKIPPPVISIKQKDADFFWGRVNNNLWSQRWKLLWGLSVFFWRIRRIRLWVFGKKSDPMKGKERERCVGGSEMAVCRNQWREREERENRVLFCFVFTSFFFLFALF